MHNYKIFEVVPSNWKELQEFVSKLLIGCGFETQIEKDIQTVRGQAEIDVYAEKTQGFDLIILCECKYWEGNVPQSVIHSFRTVVSDYGASQGYIVSRNGFQKGAYQAVQKSNVAIMNWDEFQEKFKNEWLIQIIDRNYKLGREIMGMALEISTKVINETTNGVEKNRFYEQKESDFLFFTFKEHFFELDTYNFSFHQINESINNHKKRLPVEVTCYNDYFDCIYRECKIIHENFKSIIKSGIITFNQEQ